MTTYSILIAAAIAGPPEVADPDSKLAALVEQLGHKPYALREAAGRDLIEAGARAIPALTAGLRHKAPEVVDRCRRLIPAAIAAERRKLFAQLLKEPTGPPPKGLAGAARFLEAAGNEGAARRLYAELMTAHPAIVEAMEVDPRAAARLLAEFARQCVARAEAAELAGRDPFATLLASRAEVAQFLFVRSDPRFDDTETVDGFDTMLLLRASRMKSDVAGPEAVPAMQKLFLRWLAAERQTDNMHLAFEIARQADLAEALPLALKAATDPRKHACYRAGLLLDYVAAVGGQEHIKSLAPLLEDDEGLGSLTVGDGPTLAPQVRDIALAVSIRLAGQKPADFGFHAGAFGNKDYHEYYEGYGFVSADARSTARAKWDAWLREREQSGKK